MNLTKYERRPSREVRIALYFLNFFLNHCRNDS